MPNQEVQTLYGYIRELPRLAGNKDEAARVALVTEEGTEFAILHKGIGMDLPKHINANAEVKGIVSAYEEDAQCILVRSFTLTDGFEDEWYDDSNE